MQAFALTSGPGQPEFDDFAPVGSTDLVNLFSGDFSYNIPLMNVPGPNGGYPINLSYQSGIGMEQEASWVGLGWTLNPGAVNRSMRGIPDDFKGDKIENELYIKPNVTIGLGVRTNFPEIFGADTKKFASNLALDYQFYWNNYRGTGHTLGLGLTATIGNRGKYTTNLGLGLTVSSSDGATISPSISFNHITDNVVNSLRFGMTYSSRQGMTDIGLMQTTQIKEQKVNMGMDNWGNRKEGYASSSQSVGVSFSSNGNVPNLNTDFNGFSGALSFSYQAGINIDVETPVPTIYAQFSTSWLDDKSRNANVSSYGYNYSAEREILEPDNDRAIFDFSKEKDFPVHHNVPNLPIPQFNHDQLFVSGHGVGGSFRPYRSDHGLLYDPTSESDFGAVNLGVEIGTNPPVTKLGLSIGGMYSYGYSGKWKSGLDNFYNIKQFKRDIDLLSGNYTTTQPFHYQFNNETNIVPTNFLDPVSGEKAIDIKFSPALGDLTSSVGTDLGSSGGGGSSPSTGDLSVVAQITLSGLDNNRGILKEVFKTRNAIEYFTRKERSNYVDYDVNETLKAKHIYKLGEYPMITSSYSVNPQSIKQESNQLYTGSVDHSIEHHVGEYTIQNDAGVKYTYGLPSYNIEQEMVAFALPETLDQELDYLKTVSYNSGVDDKSENNNGNDHFYSSQKVPHYATTYLLTEIKGPDYVDVTGNGITDDDLGYFVKFNYSPLTVNGNYYGWRMPYGENSAFYNPGFLEYKKDNKGTVMYGEKEVWYLNSIETKSHIAVFRLSDRADGYGVIGRNGTPELGIKLKKLDRIDLYSKVDIEAGGTPLEIKSVHFQYSYDLCGNVPNNADNLSGGSYTDENHPHKCFQQTQPNNLNKGKLTLKKIHFTYGKNNKGASSPYYFDYYERDSNCQIDENNNPLYSVGQVDRWGTYRPDDLSNPSPLNRWWNEENPYVNQKRENKSDLDKQSSVWCLKEITTPSGSVMKINYETDDYSHIQDKVPGQMCEVIGIGDGTENYFFSNSSVITEEIPLYNSSGNTLARIYFKPEFPLSSTGSIATEEVKKYIANLNDNFLYFKSFLKLAIPKNLTDNWVSDYVDGYCKVKAGANNCGWEDVTNGDDIMGFDPGNPLYAGTNCSRIPYVEVESAGPQSRHPFSFAGWQYLKTQRPDILTEDYGAATFSPVGIIASIFSIIESVIELFAGFNNMQFFKGHCKWLKEERPTLLRLSSPDNVKYGGGHRVKSIEVKDNWNSGTSGYESTYGQKYFYQMEDGGSSGVASYEPLTGGNEISLRYPHYYSDNLLQNDPVNFLEYPLGESFYPSASIGYRRVLIEDINLGKDHNGQYVTKNNTGVSEYVFYTCKEFPVITGKTNEVVDGVREHLIFPIPLIGMFSLKSDNYTQGYKIELNSMHGQLRSMATYDADHDTDGDGIWDAGSADYTNKVVYTYKTQNPQYNPNGLNKLDNNVEVLVADGVTQDVLMGVNYDFYTHMEQNSNFAIMAGLDVNLILLGSFPIPSFFPSIELSYNQAKIMVTNKILYKQGVLTKVENFTEGTVSTTENLLWDGETGDALLTRTSTEYNNHNDIGTDNDYVYNYNMPAHWAYNDLQGNYTNYRTLVKLYQHPSATTVSAFNANYVLSNTNPEIYTDKILNGDVLMLYTMQSGELKPLGLNKCYWVNNLMMDAGNGGTVPPTFTFKLMDKSGNYVLGSTLFAGITDLYAKVVTPIRTNQQSTVAGNIVTLQNPVTSRVSPFVEAYNLTIPFTSMRCGGEGVTETSLIKYFCFTSCDGTTLYGSRSIVEINGVSYLIIKVDPNLSNVPWNATTDACTEIRIQLPDYINSFHQLDAINNTYAWFIDPGSNQPYSLPIIQLWGLGDGQRTETFSNGCIKECLDGVLDAWSVDFANDYPYNFTDHGRLGSTFTSNNNKYRNGGLGIWRPKQNSVYLVNRKQKGTAAGNFHSYTGKDGTYEHFTIYVWRRPENGGPLAQSPWIFTNQYTRYSPYGQNLEIKNALNQYSSTIYGYKDALPTAVAANAAYMEIGYDGFEDYGVGTTPTYYGISPDDHNNGHLPITESNSAIDLIMTYGTGHTGNYSMYVDLKSNSNSAYIETVPTDNTGLTTHGSSAIKLVKDKEYWISFWVKKARADIDFTNTATVPGVFIYDGVTSVPIRLSNETIAVEGWYKVEGKFKVPTSPSFLRIYLWPGQKTTTDLKAYFDDIRIQPFSSNMNTYVYDFRQLYKTAELDANNYATFYVYDEEGTLVQIKKETEKGVVTVQQSRSNIKNQ